MMKEVKRTREKKKFLSIRYEGSQKVSIPGKIYVPEKGKCIASRENKGPKVSSPLGGFKNHKLKCMEKYYEFLGGGNSRHIGAKLEGVGGLIEYLWASDIHLFKPIMGLFLNGAPEKTPRVSSPQTKNKDTRGNWGVRKRSKRGRGL